MRKDEERIRNIVKNLPVFSEINLDVIERNVKTIKTYIGDNVKLLAVVKDDAYGHGSLEVSRSALSGGADYLGVTSVSEGLVLRNSGISAPTLILGKVWKNEIDCAVKNDLDFTIFEKETLDYVKESAEKYDKNIGVFVKVDTGMGRLGLTIDETFGFVDYISKIVNIKLKGLVSHFPSAECDPEFTGEQINLFSDLIEKIEKTGCELPLNHISNSAGVVSSKKSHFNMVRVGLLMYGYYPEEEDYMEELDLEISMSLRARIADIRDIEENKSISYGRKYFTDKRTKIAVLPIGYANGYMRHLSNKTYGIYKGKKVPQVGSVCMDMTMFDLDFDTDAKTGDVITLLGYDGDEMISALELSKLAGTIPYEILTNINGRVARIYLKGGKVVNIDLVKEMDIFYEDN
jgi:alanine racemase